MNKRMISINKYYKNLEYDYKDKNKIEKSLRHIHYLTSKLSFTITDTFVHRLIMTGTMMKNNLNLFMSVSEHVDSVSTINDYLFTCGAKLKLKLENKTDIELLSIIGNVLITIYYIYQENEIQKFLEEIIVGITKFEWYYEYKNALFTYLQVEIILLEDSDLYAVISYLKFKRCVSCLKKIWVQKPIMQIFMWHFKKNVGHLNIPIQMFQSKQELLASNTSENILDENIRLNVMSIWSEDVIAATNLARSLNQNMIFINTLMDICPNVMLPNKHIFLPIIESFNLTMIDKCTNILINPTAHKGLTYDLFYDGMWQKPKKNTYWIHNNILFANATSQDFIECIKSAKRGFKNLSTMSNDSKRQMLSKFASILECHGQFSLSEVVSKWINMSYLCGHISHAIKTERFDVISCYKPINTVILIEENEMTLFPELIQNLFIGNSVIVICDPDLHILAPYCNMFKMCGIPPGVINLLSTKNANDIAFDTIGHVDDVMDIMVYLTTLQHILVARK